MGGKHWGLIFLGVCISLVLFVTPQIVSAQAGPESVNVSITATVPTPTPPEQPETVVRFTGLAYPGTNLTFLRNGTFLATVPADPAARFDVSFTTNPGTYTFSISGDDADGRTGPTFNISLTVTQGTTVSITGIFLGPTIETDNTTIDVGDTIVLLGVTAPDSQVSLAVIGDGSAVFGTAADANGLWTRSLIAGQDIIATGAYEVRARAVAADSTISELSNTVTFTINEGEEDPCADKVPADINCDDFVNLVDFSIMMFYWHKTNPANARADINSDGIVDIVDFSIMMFYWTG